MWRSKFCEAEGCGDIDGTGLRLKHHLVFNIACHTVQLMQDVIEIGHETEQRRSCLNGETIM